jgi:DNA-binding CsgD family transcriptional regulator
MKPPLLTPREKEVLKLLQAKMSDKEIAEILKISVRTAQYHVSRLLKKFHLANRRGFIGDFGIPGGK